jgi:tripeptidyl-peptidase-1
MRGMLSVSICSSFLPFSVVDICFLGCHNYSLPAQVAEHVDFVVPTIQPNIKLVKSSKTQLSIPHNHPLQARDLNILNVGSAIPSGSLAGCDTAVLPACLKTLYNMSYSPKATDRNTFGIGSFLSIPLKFSNPDQFYVWF